MKAQTAPDSSLVQGPSSPAPVQPIKRLRIRTVLLGSVLLGILIGGWWHQNQLNTEEKMLVGVWFRPGDPGTPVDVVSWEFHADRRWKMVWRLKGATVHVAEGSWRVSSGRLYHREDGETQYRPRFRLISVIDNMVNFFRGKSGKVLDGHAFVLVELSEEQFAVQFVSYPPETTSGSPVFWLRAKERWADGSGTGVGEPQHKVPAPPTRQNEDSNQD
jgi:hypothetical protein